MNNENIITNATLDSSIRAILPEVVLQVLVGDVYYKLEPMEDLTPIELYHIESLRLAIMNAWTTTEVYQQIHERILKHNINRHFINVATGERL